MSSTIEQPVVSSGLVDRRRPSAGPRLSWASPQPFIPRRRPSDAASAATAIATAGRRDWQKRVIGSHLLGDSGVAFLVLLAVGQTLGHPLLLDLAAAALSSLAWVTVLAVLRAYDVRRTGSGPEELQAVMRAAVVVGMMLGLVSYTIKLELPRRYVFCALPAVALLTMVARYVQRRRLHRRRQLHQDGFRTLVVGPRAAVLDAASKLACEPHHGYQIVGVCLPSFATDAVGLPAPLLGAMADVPQVVVDHALDVVLVVGDELSGESLRRLSWALERTDADLVVAPGLVEVVAPRLEIRPTAGLSLLHLEPPSRRATRRLGKDVVDRVLGGVLLAGALPVLVVAGLAVMLTSRGGVLYRQVRIGRDGRPFEMYKLRTMVKDAGQLRDGLLDNSDRDGPMFKMRHDPRITPVGRVLRRFSLDELPQLINVVRGDMSLVGPRPPLPQEVDCYLDFVNRRLHVRPGLTGLWQVSGRADLDWERSVNLDLRYVDNWSLALDLQILWKTARAVVRGSGAY